MIHHTQRYGRALKRNLHELHRALCYRNAINALSEVAPTTNWSFFSYSSLAMHAELFSHLIKVLDKHVDTASFFFIYNVNPNGVKVELKKCELTLSEINQFAVKLKLVRDKTHFHIDKTAVFAPNEIWKQANITGNKLNHILECLWGVLNALYASKYNHKFGQPIYTGSDIKKIVGILNSNGVQI